MAAGVAPRELASLSIVGVKLSAEAEQLMADAKIDVNEFFASGKSAADFEAILAAAQTPLEMAIVGAQPRSRMLISVGCSSLSSREIGRLDPIEQDRAPPGSSRAESARAVRPLRRCAGK